MSRLARFGGAKPFAQKQGQSQEQGLLTSFKNALASGRLNLSSRGLQEVPIQSFLDVASGGVEGVSFWEVVDLRTLDISHNSIQHIPACCADLQSLEVLNAQHNPLQQWPAPFCQLILLKALDLNFCDLQELPAEIINLEALVSLSLCNNHLTDIENLLLGGFPELQILKLIQNNIRSLPDDAIWPMKLLHLNLSGNQLSELSNSVCLLQGLETLDVSGNLLTSLPATLLELTKLQSFNARENHLSGALHSLPASAALHTVMLGRNQLQSMREVEFERCPNLSMLDVSENKLTELPNTICCLGHLKTLDATNNELGNLPYGLGYISSLSRIAVDGNRLRSIRRTLLHSCEQLKKYLRTRGDPPPGLDVSLSYDGHRGGGSHGSSSSSDMSFESGVIARTREIGISGRLNLSSILNGDESLSKRTRASDEILNVLLRREDVGSVHTLDLSSNDLTFIPTVLFSAMSDPNGAGRLQTIVLSNNQLEQLPEDLARVPLISLDLSGNVRLGDSVGQCLPHTLCHLNLTNIDLLSIPFALFESSLSNTLESLILNSNSRLRDVSNHPWSKLLRLRELGIASCHLTVMPRDLHLMKTLEIVDCSNNDITDLPPTLSLSTSLKVLRVDGNGLKSVRYDVVRGGTDRILTYLGKKLPEEYQLDVQHARDSRLYGRQQGGGGGRGGGGNSGNSGNSGGSKNNDQRMQQNSLMAKVDRLDAEIQAVQEEISQNTSMSQAKKYAMNKKVKLLKAQRIRATREAQRKG